MELSVEMTGRLALLALCRGSAFNELLLLVRTEDWPSIIRAVGMLLKAL